MLPRCQSTAYTSGREQSPVCLRWPTTGDDHVQRCMLCLKLERFGWNHGNGRGIEGGTGTRTRANVHGPGSW